MVSGVKGSWTIHAVRRRWRLIPFVILYRELYSEEVTWGEVYLYVEALKAHGWHVSHHRGTCEEHYEEVKRETATVRPNEG